MKIPTLLFAAAVSIPTLALAQETEETTEKVEMDLPTMPGMPGGSMNVKVKVKTTKTTTTTRTQDDAPPPPPAGSIYGRDCGTGSDPGCTMRRRGELPMDAETFSGFLQALKGTANEITREEQANDMLASNYLTALQLSKVLDLFQNEITRLDVAKVAAPKVVNPKHALGYASKFQNSIRGSEYTKLMAAQR
jgi:hypothetical protein